MSHGRWNRVKVLQRMLTRSFSAKALAVRKVCSNRGARTPGIDGVRLNTQAQRMHCILRLDRRGYRAQPLRRIRIPKGPGSDKTRPLGISTIRDRAMMTLHQFALEPVAESGADTNSYGFRPYRSVRDAVEQGYKVFRQKGSCPWILEADIQSCFDEMSHDWILANIPVDKGLLRQWLKCGYFEKHEFFPTKTGVPQGSPIAPAIANMVLDGLEKAVKAAFPRKTKVHFVRYADDFIVGAETRERLEREVLPVLDRFLEPRGLRLSRVKTQITHIEDGFDFLGKNFRKYGGKLLIQPSKKSIQSITAKIRDTVRRHRGQAAAALIKALNPIIRGWAEAQKTVQAATAYCRVEKVIFDAIWRWARRSHPKKSKSWIVRRYFGVDPRTGKWGRFHDTAREGREGVRRRVTLAKPMDVKLVRYIKIRGDANPHDPGKKDYFMRRRRGEVYRELTAPGWKRSSGHSPDETPWDTAIKLLG